MQVASLTQSNPLTALGFMPPQPVVGHATIYRAGGEVYAQGEAAGTLSVVEFGMIRLYRLLIDGRRQIADFRLPGEVFGFEADRIHHCSAEAIITSGIRSVPRSAAADTLLPLALRSLTQAQDRLMVLGRQSATERVAGFLLDMQARQDDAPLIHLPMIRNDIADYLGLTLETVSRILSRLKRERAIDVPTSRSVRLLRPNLLRTMSL